MSIRVHLSVVNAVFAVFVASATDYQLIDVVGDSVSWGANPELPTEYGWVQMLFGETSPGIPAKEDTVNSLWPSIQVFNSSVSGSTAEQWALDFGGRLSAVKARGPDLVILQVGGNDFINAFEENENIQTIFDDYRVDLEAIITELQSLMPVPDIVIVGYYDLFDGYSENLTGDLQWLSPASQVLPEGHTVMKEVADQYGCFYVSLAEAFHHHGYGAELGDAEHTGLDYLKTPLSRFDLHPVTAGHDVIYDEVHSMLSYLKSYGTPLPWMDQFGLTNYFEDAGGDPDADGHLSWEEHIAGTDPTNALSVFDVRLENDHSSIRLHWEKASNRVYSIYSATSVVSEFELLIDGLTTNAFLDQTPNSHSAYYYMVVELP